MSNSLVFVRWPQTTILFHFLCQDTNKNVRIHCKSQRVVHASQFFLACASDFLRTLFTSCCSWNDARTTTYDLVCPGFEPEAVEKVLEMVSGSNIYINKANAVLYNEIRFVLNQLKIRIDLPPILNPDLPEVNSTEMSLSCSAEEEIDVLSDIAQDSTASDLPEESGRPLICAFCQKEFRTLEVMDGHLETHFTNSESTSISETTRSSWNLVPTAKRFQPPVALIKRQEIFNGSKNSGSIGAGQSTLDSLNLDIKEELQDHDSGSEREVSKASTLDQSQETSSQENFLVISTTEGGLELRSDPAPVYDVSDSSDTQSEVSATSYDASATTAAEPDWYECHICQKKSTKYSNIVLHVGRKHFKEELVRIYHPSQRNTCRKCQKKFPCEFDLDGHIVRFHKAIEKLMPSEDQLKVLKPDGNAKNPAVQDSYPGNFKRKSTSMQSKAEREKPGKRQRQASSDDDEMWVPPKRKKISSVHKCPECPAKVERLSNLKGHFAMVHRKQDMLALVGESGVDCNLCFRRYSNQASLFFHLGNSHDTLKGVFSSPKANTSSVTLNNSASSEIRTPERQVYPCPKCSHDFKGYKDLLTHLATEHFKAELLQSFSENDNSCKECADLFQSNDQDNLAKHLATQHMGLTKHLPTLGRKKMECAFCGKIFKKACGWVIHERVCQLKTKPVEADQVMKRKSTT